MASILDRILCRQIGSVLCFTEVLENRRLLAAVTLDAATTYQTIQGWGTAAVYPNSLVTIAQAGAIMRDAGMNVVRITAGPGDYAYTVGGNMRTPVPISANLDENVARFTPGGTSQTDLIQWLEANAIEPDRVKMIGALWSPPQWMKITTGRLITWDENGVSKSGYDPVVPWGDYSGNSGAGRVNPTMWTDWARFVLSTIKVFEQRTGLPMSAFSFQNEPNVPTSYSSCTFDEIANDVNNPSAGYTAGHWELYGDGMQALANELALHPEITTKFFGPELSQLGGPASNPYNMSAYNAVRQNLIDRGLLQYLGAYATHDYTNAKDDDAALWDAWYNGSAHAANILSGGTSSWLGYLGPQPGIAGDNKEIWQTETDGEDQTWTKDGAMAFGLKIYNALVYGHVSGYTTWDLTGYNATDQWGVVQLGDISNPTNSYKYDAFKQFSRWIRPGAQRINATFENGKASIGGANELDTYNGLNVAAFNHAQDKRLTMVFVNMQTTGQSTTITIPAGMNIASFQVYQTSGTQKYVQLANLIPGAGKITLTVPASSFVTITGSYATQTLPTGWSSADIGAPAKAGLTSWDSNTGTFTLTGGGTDIWDTSDQCQFASRSFTGDGSVIARVSSVTNTNAWAKAGVMFRDSTAAGATFADVVVSYSSGVSFQWRNSTGGYCDYASASTWTAAPAWVKLTRSGNSFTAFYATTTGTPDAADWKQIGSAQTIAMGSSVRTGLAVTSHNASALCTGTFTGVETTASPSVVTPASATPNPATGSATNLSVLGTEDGGEANLIYTWIMASGPAAVSFSNNRSNSAKNTTAIVTQAGTYTFQVSIADISGSRVTSTVSVPVTFGIFTSAQDIGTPTSAGSNSYDPSTDTYTAAAGGSDIWDPSDQFRLLSRSFTGDGSIIARVTGVSNTNTWAKAGVMLRDSSASNAMFADVVVTPGSGVSFQWRNSTGGSCGYAQMSGVRAPAWVKLVRAGNSFTAFYATTTGTPTSTDWKQVGAAQTIAMSSSAQAGLAVTSHNTTSLCTATFSGVQVNQTPTVATAASASPNPITGKTTTLSVLGADDGGEANLSYSWRCTSKPSGAADPSFSINGTNAAKSTIATFSQSGSYSFTVTISDAGGLSTTSSVSMTVLPAWLAPGSAASWNPATGVLSVTGPTTIIADPGADAPIIQASGSTAVLSLQPASGMLIHLGGLQLSSGARADVPSLGSARTHANHRVLILGTLSGAAPLLSIDAQSKLDLEDNDLIVHNGSYGEVQAMATTGRHGSSDPNHDGSILDATWTGNGLTSSAAAAEYRNNYGQETTALAVVRNGDLDNYVGRYQNWLGEGLGANDILVKYTYIGDWTLAGCVSDDAWTVFSGDWNQQPSDFYNGDAWAAGSYNGGAIDDDAWTAFSAYWNYGSDSHPLL